MNASTLVELVTDQTSYMVETLMELMRIPAFGATGQGYSEIAALLEQKMAEAGLEVEAIEVPFSYLTELWGNELERTYDYLPVQRLTERAIIFGRRDGAKPGAPSLHLTQHYDLPGYFTSEITDREVELQDGKIFARGISQCRAGIVAMLGAARALAEANAELGGNLFVSFTPDNHLGGESGAGYLAEKGLGKSDMVITGSAGGPDTIVLGYKGALWLKITTHGVAALASEPHRGINAIDKMTTIQQALAGLDATYVNRRSRWPIVPAESARPTLVSARISSTGSGVPDTCVMYVDRRLTPEETAADALEEIMSTIRSLQIRDPDLVVDVEPIHSVASVATQPDVRLATTLGENIRRILGVEPRMALFAYYSEFRVFPQAWGSQTVDYSPGMHEQPDGAPDHVAIDDLVAAAKVLALTARDLLA